MNSIEKSTIAIGALSMAMAVILGALGAHALEALISAEQLDSFKTGVRYQVWHSLALIVLGFSGSKLLSTKNFKILSSLFIGGIIFFSISIYLLSTRDLLGIESWKSVLGPITPIGGLLLIVGWLFFAYRAWTAKKTGISVD
ncbi:DUF423 domain-containing protein [Cryomorphaceae bacterium 1068]|nr:DUF423 domain-containing protein [Cryomorphaceae bacterium 1068]